MNVEWVKGSVPPEDGYYVVKIDMRSYHFEFPSLRKFKEGAWQLTHPGETIVAWLMGLKL